MTASDLPEPTKKPCNECPWRRAAGPGFLGPHPADEWAAMAHSGGPIACHKTIKVEEDWSQPNLRQCAGAATFRANAAIPARSSEVATGPADTQHVFVRSEEFIEHHGAPAEGTPEGLSALGQVLIDRLMTMSGDAPAVEGELTRWADDLGPDRMAQASRAALSVMFGERIQQTRAS